MKTADPESYNVEMEEYRKVYGNSESNYSEFNICFGMGSMEGAGICLDNMKKFLEYSDAKVKELYGNVNLGQSETGTDMVVADPISVPTNGEIPMESVSPIVAMWKGMSPAVRNLIKAAAIAAAIFGAKKGYDKLMERSDKSKLKANRMEQHRHDDNDDDDDGPDDGPNEIDDDSDDNFANMSYEDED
jgi:hypothetical protein